MTTTYPPLTLTQSAESYTKGPYHLRGSTGEEGAWCTRNRNSASGDISRSGHPGTKLLLPNRETRNRSVLCSVATQNCGGKCGSKGFLAVFPALYLYLVCVISSCRYPVFDAVVLVNDMRQQPWYHHRNGQHPLLDTQNQFPLGLCQNLEGRHAQLAP